MIKVPCDFAIDIGRPAAVECSLELFGGRPSAATCLRRCGARQDSSGRIGSEGQPKPDQAAKDAAKINVAMPPAVLAARMAACLSCDGLRRMIRNVDDQTHIGCRHCGCGSMNLGSSAASCPLSKWNKEIADG